MERELLHGALKPGPECVSIEELGRYADGTLPPHERSNVTSHVDGCANCQAELALLRAFTDATVRDHERDIVDDGVARLRRHEPAIFVDARRTESGRNEWLPWPSLRAAFSLAAVLLAVIGSFYLFKSDVPRLPSDVAGTETTRSLTVIARAPIGDQTNVPERCEWQPVPGAERYHVSLMEVDRHEIWAADTTDTFVMLPPAVRGQIIPAKTLVWQVKAFGAGAAPIAESGVERFRLVLR
jgi:Putative zinc-finger